LLTTHRIDAVVAPAALGYQLELAKRGRLVLSHFELGHEFVGQALYASNRIIHDDPKAVRGFVKAWLETIAWMRGHKDETSRSPATTRITRPRSRTGNMMT